VKLPPFQLVDFAGKESILVRAVVVGTRQKADVLLGESINIIVIAMP